MCVEKKTKIIVFFRQFFFHFEKWQKVLPKKNNNKALLICHFFSELAGPRLVAKKSEKKYRWIFFDLTSAVFWANDFLTHPINGNNRNLFYLSRFGKSENAIRFLSSRHLIWAFVEPDSMKKRELAPFEKCRSSRFDRKIDIFQFCKKGTNFRVSLRLFICRKIIKKY